MSLPFLRGLNVRIGGIRTLITHPLTTKRKQPVAKRASIIRPTGERTYNEELYSARRIDLSNATGKAPFNYGISRLFDVMRTEGIIGKVRSKREWIRPGLVKSLGRMKRRQA